MFLADTLSRPMDLTRSLTLSDDHLLQTKILSSDDPVLQVLSTIIRCGWPESKSNVPESIHAYFDFRDELMVHDQLVFKR